VVRKHLHTQIYKVLYIDIKHIYYVYLYNVNFNLYINDKVKYFRGISSWKFQNTTLIAFVTAFAAVGSPGSSNS